MLSNKAFDNSIDINTVNSLYLLSQINWWIQICTICSWLKVVFDSLLFLTFITSKYCYSLNKIWETYFNKHRWIFEAMVFNWFTLSNDIMVLFS